MSLNPALCFAGFDDDQSRALRLAILGFGERAKSYLVQASRRGASQARPLDTLVFVSPGTPAWSAAKSTLQDGKAMTLFASRVSAILPITDATSGEPRFVIETAVGNYSVDDLFVEAGGAAISGVTLSR